MDDDDKHKTKLSTFKPKALRNPKTYKNLNISGDEKKKQTKAEVKSNELVANSFSMKS